MRKIGEAPIKNRIDLDNKDAGISEPWRKYFDAASRASSKYDSKTFTSHAVLTTKDFGKVIKMKNGAGTAICYLPSVASGNIDSWIIIVRLGTGKVIVRAADSDTIESSVAGGEVDCDEVGRIAANILLCLVEETKWAIFGGTGIWRVY